MQKRARVTETYLVAEQCECGGLFSERLGPEGDFRCSGCGAIRRLSEPEFPTIKYTVEEYHGND